MCDDTLLLVRHALDKQQVKVTLDYQASCPVEINTQQIQQVLVNLILNAAHAMDAAGDIHLSTTDWLEGDNLKGVRITVSDQGQGISAEHLEKIFDPFFTTKESGTGLGLSVSYGIVQRHGGQLFACSTLGEGTEFTILLPEHAARNDAPDNTTGLLLDGLAQAERTNRRSIRRN